jgi:phytanoyl-CoA hydroxylase
LTNPFFATGGNALAILTETMRKHFQEDGYLVVPRIFDPARDFAPLLREYSGVLDGIATELLERGEIRSAYSELPFEQRLTTICEESGRNFPQYFDFSLPQSNIRHDTPMHVGPAVFALLSHPRMLDLAEELVGPEIFSNPVQHVRFKLPRRAVTPGPNSALIGPTPWHQDNGVIMPEADDARILTVWFPINACDIESGCLQVLPRSHRTGLVGHCLDTSKQVAIPLPRLELRDAVPLPMTPGSVLLLTQRTVHGALDNTTNHRVRISLDLRYQRTGEPTGRPAFAHAGFIARSRSHPERELHDAAVWAQHWHDVRAKLADTNPPFNRWHADAACA